MRDGPKLFYQALLERGLDLGKWLEAEGILFDGSMLVAVRPTVDDFSLIAVERDVKR